ncbi:MAG: PIN domain-containing protein [Thermoplasmata archaeon]|nr:PIN domain-containing protein [Thermoplasmata archaeon]
MKKLKIYLDTSVFSAYFDERDIFRMNLTIEFWKELENHDRYISTVVREELSAITDENLLQKLSDLTGNFKVLEIDAETENLADIYLKEGVIPRKELNDAIHLASSTINEIDVLVSWNFRHLVKRKTRIMVNLINTRYNYRNIEIVAPPEL